MNACGGGTHLLPLEIIGLCVAGPQSPVFWGPSERKKSPNRCFNCLETAILLNPILV